MSQLPKQSIYGTLAFEWARLRRSHGVRLREVACVGAPRTLLVAELGDPRGPAVTISAGVHGDEPAGPAALLALVRDGLLDPAFSYRLWPCLNPTGAEAGTRASVDGRDVNRSYGRGGTTPESRAVLTANRDRRFALWIDLHEDLEADGFYVFETLRPAAGAAFAGTVAAAVAEAGFPLHARWSGFEIGPPGIEDAQTLGPGTILVDADRELAAFGGELPLGLVVAGRSARHMLTFESPCARPWNDRIAMHRVAVTAALGRLRAMVGEGPSRSARSDGPAR